MRLPKTLVVMGVSASGKTTVSNLLGAKLDYRVLDADDLHPRENVEKMRRGIALDDADRLPWLHKVAEWISEQRAQNHGVVVSCSALKRSYRDILRGADADAVCVWLDVDRATLDKRITHRRDHFMPASLLDDQLNTLQPPAADERALRICANAGVDHLIGQVITQLGKLA